jgi:5-methylcytosine-specific restriction protein A
VVASPGFCDRHRGSQHQDYARARRGFDEELGFYRSAAWRSARAALLREEPLCRVCRAGGRLAPATVVDHVRPIKDGGARFDAANLQPLCPPCHNRKTARETARANAGLRGRSV